MTDIIDIEHSLRKAMCGDLAAHFLRQAGNLLLIMAAESQATETPAPETLDIIGGNVLLLAQKIQVLCRKGHGAPVVIRME